MRICFERLRINFLESVADVDDTLFCWLLSKENLRMWNAFCLLEMFPNELSTAVKIWITYQCQEKIFQLLDLLDNLCQQNYDYINSWNQALSVEDNRKMYNRMGFCKTLVLGLSFYSMDGACGWQKMVSQHEIFQLILWIGFHGLRLLARFVA
jgi:hypothetical protein